MTMKRRHVGQTVYIVDALVPAGIDHLFINGVWLCVKDVPSKTVSDYINAHQGDFDSSYDRYKRVDGINYYPTWPMPDADAEAGTQQRYWLLIGIYPVTMNVCENNIKKTYFVAAAESGSFSDE